MSAPDLEAHAAALTQYVELLRQDETMADVPVPAVMARCAEALAEAKATYLWALASLHDRLGNTVAMLEAGHTDAATADLKQVVRVMGDLIGAPPPAAGVH